MKSPYRVAENRKTQEKPTALQTDLSLIVALGLFWVISVVRVTGAFVRHEVFGGESTLALMAVIGIPLLLLSGRAQAARADDPDSLQGVDR
jgi:hypothetical protein